MCAEEGFIWGPFLAALVTAPNLLLANIPLNMLQLITWLFFTSHFNSGSRGRHRSLEEICELVRSHWKYDDRLPWASHVYPTLLFELQRMVFSSLLQYLKDGWSQ